MVTPMRSLSHLITRAPWAIGAGALTGLMLGLMLPSARASSVPHDAALLALPNAPAWPEEVEELEAMRAHHDRATEPRVHPEASDVGETEWGKKALMPPSEETRLVRYGVSFFHSHTKEILPIPVTLDEEGDIEADLVSDVSDADLARFLRCRVTHVQHPMARVPSEVAVAMARHFERRRVLVVSGYRSLKHNLSLRKKGHEVARASYHMWGEALDFQLPGISARDLADAVMDVHRGGVGRYDVSRFVHVDIGPRRDWRGR